MRLDRVDQRDKEGILYFEIWLGTLQVGLYRESICNAWNIADVGPCWLVKGLAKLDQCLIVRQLMFG